MSRSLLERDLEYLHSAHYKVYRKAVIVDSASTIFLSGFAMAQADQSWLSRERERERDYRGKRPLYPGAPRL